MESKRRGIQYMRAKLVGISLIIFCSGQLAMGQEALEEPTPLIPAPEKHIASVHSLSASLGTTIDWKKRVIFVTGRGYAPKRITREHSIKIMSLQAAKGDAYRKLAALLYGIHVTKTTTVDQFGQSHTFLKKVIKGTVKNAKITQTRYLLNQKKAIIVVSYPIKHLERTLINQLKLANTYQVPEHKLIYKMEKAAPIYEEPKDSPPIPEANETTPED